MDEVWKEIEGTHYSVSNLGRIRNDLRNKIIKQNNDKDGYKLVGISYGGIIKKRRVHRLVAQAFIPNPNNYEQVNHINAIKSDNAVSNLEWCSLQQNLEHSYINGLHSRKRVEATSTDVQVVGVFISTHEAARAMGVANASISSACNRNHRCKGLLWRFV